MSETPVSMSFTAETSASARSPWIYAPWVDLLIGCGGWSAPLLLAGYYAAGTHARMWSVTFYFLALLFNYPHFMATVYRAYHSHSEFQKYRIYTLHVALLLAIAGIVAHVWYPLLPWIFTLYICWSPWHYTGQNFGLLMMFARRAGIVPTTKERQALRLSFVASYVMLMLSFHTGPSGDALILSLGLPTTVTLPARIAFAAFFLVASAWALHAMARRSSFRAIFAPLLLATTQFLWFLLPALIELASGHEVPQTRYSSGILAILHSTQYLWITSYYQRKEARAAGNKNWNFWGYLVTLVAGGIALFIPGPWIVSRVFHVDFASSFLLFTALVNIHHFILDGALWKLRDSRISSLLVDSKEKIADASSNAQNGIGKAFRWITGSSAGARIFRIATALALLACGAMDQLHFYWSSEASNLASLQHAAQLNPDDSTVQIKLARAEALAGKREASLQALQRAAQISPGSLAVQQSYARGLIEAGREADALHQYEQILSRWNRNADALVNYGLLQQKLGHTEEAVESWQRAVDADPAQAHAQLYLAQSLEQRGEPQAAARHYEAYLQIVAAHQDDYQSEAPTVLVALLKVADADAAANRVLPALTGYKAAIDFAERSSDKTIESLALVHLAELQEKQKDAAGAAQSYQRALILDESLSDPRSAASDWYNYGQFLQRQLQAEQFIFVCFLQAENILKSFPGDELSTIVHARTQSESRLGLQSLNALRTKDSLTKEVLSLPPSSFSSHP